MCSLVLLFMDGGPFSINATLGASLSPEAVAALLGFHSFFVFLSLLLPILVIFPVKELAAVVVY